jgi:hypothetical protein
MIPSDICSYPNDAAKKMSLRLRRNRHNRTYKLKPYHWNPTTSVIPLHIYQIWHNLDEMPDSVKESTSLLKQQLTHSHITIDVLTLRNKEIFKEQPMLDLLGMNDIDF